MRADLRLVSLRALLDIRLHVELAASSQETRHRIEQRGAHHESLVMTLLPPRIGKVNEEGVHRTVGLEALESQLGILREDSAPRAEAMLSEPPIDDRGPFALDLEAHHRELRYDGEPLEQKAASAGADFDLDAVARALVQRADIDFPLAGETGGVGVGADFRLRFHTKTRAAEVARPDAFMQWQSAFSERHLPPPAALPPSPQDFRVFFAPRWRRRARALVPWAAALLVTACLAHASIRGILDRTGHPAVPLDDAFIHFQYAKRLAEGHLFSFLRGEGFSSGATSLVWPLLLAPFHALGLRDLSIIWAAWGLSFLALAGLAIETYRLASRLTGSATALGAAAMVLAFGGHIWSAASGMEVTLFAWVLARTGRLCAEWGELSTRGSRLRNQLLAFGLLAPLVRPEGAIASLMAAAALAIFPTKEGGSFTRRRALGLVPLAGPLLPPCLNYVMTGSAASSTTTVKWLPANPYYGDLSNLARAIWHHVHLFFHTLLDGREWSAIFLPTGSRPFAIAALFAIPVAGYLAKRRWRASLVLVLALGMLLPATYDSFLWNRLRYLWPFTFAWLVGLACLARVIGDMAGMVHPRWVKVAPMLTGIVVGLLASHLPWTLHDLQTSAAAIDAQQVTLGRWASHELSPDARIGVNDTGAIAYLSGRHTFDIVGLTTPDEARHWVAGPGSRYEHYERLGKTDPARLPSHFIVYPHWMAIDAVLGEELSRATVTDQTILGGTTMVAYEARWEVLGRGDRPENEPPGELLDVLDVADLESEREHDYALFEATAAENVTLSLGEGPTMKVDGARLGRTRDELVAHLKQGMPTLLVARLHVPSPMRLQVTVGGRVLEPVEVPGASFLEVEVPLPGEALSERTPIRIEALDGQSFGSMHYWFYAEGEGRADSGP